MFRGFPLFFGVGRSLARALGGRALAFPALAVLATAALIASGADRAARDFFVARNPLDTTAARFACLQICALWPILFGLARLRRGLRFGDTEATASACAVLQSVIVVGALTALLKLATGRPRPEDTVHAAEFHFLAFDAGSLRVMWPSGHTTESFGAAGAIVAFYRSRRAAVAAYALAALVASAMLVGCFHWVSDVAAGALIAYPIGREIGRTFRAWADERADLATAGRLG